MLLVLEALALAGPQADLHLDTPTQLHRQSLTMDAPGLEAGIAQLQAGGTDIAVEVLWPPRDSEWLAHATMLMDTLEAEIARLDVLTLATTPAEARAASEAETIAIIISMEGAHGLGDGDWSAALDGFHARGLRLLGVTWSMSNRFAGSSGDGGGGLTDEGRALVERARALKIMLDVSHASRAATLEICQRSPVPVIASHSDAHGLNENPRNLTDEEIVCIAKTGGVIGVNFHAPFVGGARDVKAVADHVEYLAKIGGHQAVALGSDYDGMIQKPAGLEDASKLPALWAELESRGWTEAQLDGLKGENFLRAWTIAQMERG